MSDSKLEIIIAKPLGDELAKLLTDAQAPAQVRQVRALDGESPGLKIVLGVAAEIVAGLIVKIAELIAEKLKGKPKTDGEALATITVVMGESKMTMENVPQSVAREVVDVYLEQRHHAKK